MPRINHTAIQSFDSHRARRDSDAVRARQAFWRFNHSTTLGQRSSGLAVSSAETHAVVPITLAPGSSHDS